MIKGTRYLPGEIEQLRVLGRTVKDMNPLVLFWTGAGFELNYQGTELWCEFEAEYSCYEQWIAVFVNGALLSRQMLQKGKQSICLFRNMQTQKVNHVKVVKEVQAMPGDEEAYLAVHAFYGEGTFCELKAPQCRIEFIGDSITSGEGSYGSTREQDWIAMWFSFSGAYPYLVSERLQAECRVLSQSGYGVYCAYDNNLDHAMPLYYEQVCGVLSGERNEKLGVKKVHDFSSWQPDYVVINLGTNDGGAFHNPEWREDASGRSNKMYNGEDGLPAKECLERVQKAVTDFLYVIRKNNPDAWILWAYGMMGTIVEPAILAGINEFKNKSGDKKTDYIRLEEVSGEQIGARSHPGLQGHEVAAETICKKICELKGEE